VLGESLVRRTEDNVKRDLKKTVGSGQGSLAAFCEECGLLSVQ
jgi:hypothetical protein